jgi:hypothetical protein
MDHSRIDLTLPGSGESGIPLAEASASSAHDDSRGMGDAALWRSGSA